MDGWSEGPLPEAEVRGIVGAGYDEMGDRFDRWADAARGSPRDVFVNRLFELVPSGERVLEIGCGSGARSTQALARRYRLTGIDLSARQIERARQRIPSATFMVEDAMLADFPSDSFRAIAAYYVMNHIPSGQHAGLYARIASWLKPGGVFTANLPVSGGGDGIETSWLGVPMFFASLDEDENLRLIRACDLEVLDSALISETEVDPDDPSSTEEGSGSGLWLGRSARRPGSNEPTLPIAVAPYTKRPFGTPWSRASSRCPDVERISAGTTNPGSLGCTRLS